MVNKLYKTVEVAKLFGKSDETIRRWIKRGILKAIKMGNQWYVKKEDLDEALQMSDDDRWNV